MESKMLMYNDELCLVLEDLGHGSLRVLSGNGPIIVQIEACHEPTVKERKDNLIKKAKDNPIAALDALIISMVQGW